MCMCMYLPAYVNFLSKSWSYVLLTSSTTFLASSCERQFGPGFCKMCINSFELKREVFKVQNIHGLNGRNGGGVVRLGVA